MLVNLCIPADLPWRAKCGAFHWNHDQSEKVLEVFSRQNQWTHFDQGEVRESSHSPSPCKTAFDLTWKLAHAELDRSILCSGRSVLGCCCFSCSLGCGSRPQPHLPRTQSGMAHRWLQGATLYRSRVQRRMRQRCSEVSFALYASWIPRADERAADCWMFAGSWLSMVLHPRLPITGSGDAACASVITLWTSCMLQGGPSRRQQSVTPSRSLLTSSAPSLLQLLTRFASNQ